MCLVETWLPCDKNMVFRLNEYINVSEYVRKNSVRSGAAIFTSCDNNIRTNEIEQMNYISLEGVFNNVVFDHNRQF